MAEPETTPEETAPDTWNWVDTCGIIAGVVLVVILIDVFTDGRLVSRRLKARPVQPAPEQVPDE